MVLISKALSGGHVPVGALLTRKWIFDKLFDRMDRAVVHGSTFAKNDLAMAAGLATLDVHRDEALVEQSERLGERLRRGFELRALRVCGSARQRPDDRHRVRPAELAEAQSGWNLLESANSGLFCQLITIPLLRSTRS